MMNTHRGGVWRNLAGLGVCSVTALAGIAFTDPAAASIGAQPATHVLTVETESTTNSGGASPSDLALLASKCRHAQRGGGRRHLIICDGDEVRDPQVQAIADRIAADAQRRARAALPRPEELAEIRAEADRAKAYGQDLHAQVELARRAELDARAAAHANIDPREQQRIAREAMESANAALDSVNPEEIQASVSAAMAAIDSNEVRASLAPAQLEEVRRALEEVRAHDIAAELRHARDDMHRELEHLNQN